MSNSLFEAFKQVSAKEWKQKIQVDLKGADYNETLIWKNLEGIDVKPFYHQDDFKEEPAFIPGHPKVWKIAQEIFIDDETIANKLLVYSIKRGAEAVFITSNKEFTPEIVFENFPFENTAIYFSFRFLSEAFVTQLKLFFSKLSNENKSIYYNIDIIGNLTRTGNWHQNLNKDHAILENLIKNNTNENIISVDASIYQNSGGNIVQQIAYGLSHANEYLNHFCNHTNSDSANELNITFQLAIGSNYFFEIAKIRALRKLYATLANVYGISTTCQIITTPSKRNKTLYDYNVNLLRTTTEYMSAILGGANTICSKAYDAIYHKSNEFGERIARNQLLILKHESYFKASDNPAKGSYYIESLTEQLADKALSLFKEIEANGGFLKQLKEGTIQRKIKETAAKEQQLFNKDEIELLGTNTHWNIDDKMKNELELYPFVKFNPIKTLIEPLIEKRLSEKLELERLNKENQ